MGENRKPRSGTPFCREPAVTDRPVSVGGSGPQTSLSLLARIQAVQPDAAAWDRFVTLYRDLVLGWCRQSGLQESDAEDVTQEVFRSVHKAVARFRRDQPGDSLRGWLRQIAKNAICTWARQSAREVRGEGGSDARARLQAVPEVALGDVDEERDREEERELIRRALTGLLDGFKSQTRDAFWRVVVEGRRPAEVAQELGVKEHVVYLAKSRVLKRLRAEYGDLLDL